MLAIFKLLLLHYRSLHPICSANRYIKLEATIVIFLVANQVSTEKRHHSKLGAQTHPLWSFWTNEVVKYIENWAIWYSKHLHIFTRSMKLFMFTWDLVTLR